MSPTSTAVWIVIRGRTQRFEGSSHTKLAVQQHSIRISEGERTSSAKGRVCASGISSSITDAYMGAGWNNHVDRRMVTSSFSVNVEYTYNTRSRRNYFEPTQILHALYRQHTEIRAEMLQINHGSSHPLAGSALRRCHRPHS